MSEKPTSEPDLDVDNTLDPGAVTAQPGGLTTAPTVHEPKRHSEQTTSVDDEDHTESLEEKIRRKLDAAEPTKPKVDPLIGREIANRFQVISKVGAGGMGAVYRARQKGMDRDVAIKVLLKELSENETVVRRFHIEALAVSKLRHPNTIQIFDFGQTPDGLFYIAMEFLEGLPLQKVLRQQTQISVRRALVVTQQIAKSLREAHSKGIVHRDLKPDNVVLETVGEESDFVKVLDFGVAKLVEGDGKQKTLTKAGSIFGTPKYMSPEQSRGGEIDARSDVYSMGVMLYEMMLGKVPFTAENPLGILIKHLQEPPPDFQAARPDIVVPEAVQDFCYRLLEKDPARRPQTAEAVIREIDKLLSELGDLFRNVVTREDAEAAGIEISSATRTAHDTELGGLTDTFMPYGEDGRTLVGDQPLVQTKRRKWPVIVMGSLLVLLGGAGAIYASLDQLPGEYHRYTTLGQVEMKMVPDLNLEEIRVMVTSTPDKAEIVDASGKVIGTTPHLLEQQVGAAEQKLTFRKEGFLDKEVSVSFMAGSPTKVQVDMTAEKRPVVARPVTRPPPATDTSKPTTRPPSATTRPPTVEIKKVDETKANPYGKPKKVKDTKSNPYGD